MQQLFRDCFFNNEIKPQYLYLLGYIYENNYKNSSYTLNTNNGLNIMNSLYNKSYNECNKLIDINNPSGYYYLSDIYYFGYGIRRNKNKAIKLLEKCIEIDNNLKHIDAKNKLCNFRNYNIENDELFINNQWHCRNKFSHIFKKCESEYICYYLNDKK